MSLKDLNRLLKESEEIKSGNFSSILGKQFEFETIDEASEYYEKEINTNSNNFNPAFENALNSWLEDNRDDIRESYEENHPALQDDEMGKDQTYDR
jgi:hypothetical protein